MTDLRVTCIGAGYFSQFHVDAWKRVDGASPVAVVDRDLDKALATGIAAFANPSKMLSVVKPDIVDIITPPPTHLDIIRSAIEAGPKAIICQKPFCEDMAQARLATSLAEDAGIPLVIHENFRFQPWYRAIKQAIDEALIGDVHQITFRLRPGDGQGADAYLDRQPYFQKMQRFLVHETAVHWIDTFRYLLGSPSAVFADLRQMNPAIAGEDAGHILFAYPNGVRALFDGNRHLDHAAENTRCTMGEALIEGTGGTLELLGDGSVQYRRFGAEDPTEIFAAPNVQAFGGDCVFHLCQHVVDGVNGSRDFENTARDYLPVMQVESAIYQSSEIRSWVEL